MIFLDGSFLPPSLRFSGSTTIWLWHSQLAMENHHAIDR
jgi:hypothetical protein